MDKEQRSCVEEHGHTYAWLGTTNRGIVRSRAHVAAKDPPQNTFHTVITAILLLLSSLLVVKI